MIWIGLLSALLHHGESADPTLLEWIKETLDHLLGLGSWTVIMSLGLLIVLIPLAVMAVYLLQKQSNDSRRDNA